MSSPYVTRAGLLATVVVLAVAAGFVRLGIWQLDRLDQRKTRNAAIAERMDAAPVHLRDATRDTAGLLYRAAVLEGAYDHERSIILHGRSYRGAAGAHLLTPLRLRDGSGAVLVNRGWIPAIDPDRIDVAHFATPVDEPIEGVLLPFPDIGTDDTRSASSAPAAAPSFQRVRYRLAGEPIRRQMPYPVLAAYVQALPDPTAGDSPRRLAPPELDDGPHLSYAFQWFSFAAIALVGWAVLAVRRGEVGLGRPGHGERR